MLAALVGAHPEAAGEEDAGGLLPLHFAAMNQASAEVAEDLAWRQLRLCPCGVGPLQPVARTSADAAIAHSLVYL